MSEISIFRQYSITDLVRRVAEGALAPEEIAAEFIRRNPQGDSPQNIFAACDPAALLRQAKDSEAYLSSGNPPRCLEAIPLGVQDTINTDGLPTQMGSPLWDTFTPGNDARIVFNCRRRGALIAGKTATSEFGLHSPSPVPHPCDTGRMAGTAAAGGAVAVATGMVPAALGTQTAGSVVHAASHCGIYGCKPSFGTIPRTGILQCAASLDTVGFLAFHAEDMALLFDTLRVHGPNYPLSDTALSKGRNEASNRSRPRRIALLKTHTWPHAADYAQEALQRFARSVDAVPGCEVVETEPPAELRSAHDLFAVIYRKSTSHYLDSYCQTPERLSPPLRESIELGRAIAPEKYMEALKAQNNAARAMDKFLTEYDAALSLATAGIAPQWEEQEQIDPSLMWTMTHLPVVCAPAFTGPQGLPFGVQVLARRFDDYGLFAFVDMLCRQGVLPACSRPAPHVI